jgi:hypothetical protein
MIGAASSADPGRLVLLDGRRWSTLLVILSLDVVRPHYPRMRLHVRESFVPLVRDVIRRRASLARRQPLEPSYFVPDALRAIARSFDEDTCAGLIHWGRTIFTFARSEYPTLRQWTDVLAAAVGDNSRWRALRLPPDVSDEARRRFASAEEAVAAGTSTAVAHEEPLSDWDVCLYTLRGFDDEDLSDNANRPLRWVGDTAGTARRREYWRWLLSRLTAERQRMLVTAASQFAGGDLLRPPHLMDVDDE